MSDLLLVIIGLLTPAFGLGLILVALGMGPRPRPPRLENAGVARP